MGIFFISNPQSAKQTDPGQISTCEEKFLRVLKGSVYVVYKGLSQKTSSSREVALSIHPYVEHIVFAARCVQSAPIQTFREDLLRDLLSISE